MITVMHLFGKYIHTILKYVFYIPVIRIIDLLFPVQRHSNRSSLHNSLLEQTKEEEFLLNVQKDFYRNIQKVEIHRNTQYILKYKTEWVTRLIWKFKYYLDPNALLLCANIVHDHLISDVSDRILKTPFRTPYILLYYPSSTFATGAKKFDHMKELLILVDALQNKESSFFTCCIHALIPKNNHEHNAQHKGTKRQRLEWAQDRVVMSENFKAFIEHSTQQSKPTIYCIDDIVTTGASLESVSKMLTRELNTKVITFCICH